MKKNVNDLVRLHKAMQEKKQHHFRTKSKLLPWYLINGFECTVQNILMSFNTLFELHMKSKTQVEYQQNLLLKKGKTITTETLYLLTNAYKDDNFSRQLPEKKDYVSVSKGVHEPNFATCKSLCNLQKLCTALKEKHPNINIGFSKFCTLRPKWCLLDGSKMTHSVCVCGVHKNVALLVDAMDWKFSCKDLIKLTLSCLKYFH